MFEEARHYVIIFVVVLLYSLTGCAPFQPSESSGITMNLSPQGKYLLIGEKHLISDFPAYNSSGNINVVVEIPTGTNAKWETDKASGGLKWEFKDGKPRVVSYIGYPGNYGMIPRSSLPKERGGDGDPLDVLVLGQALARGTVIAARPIGVLKLLDGGEQDDKIIAVTSGSIFGKISSVDELDREFSGVTKIIELWFSNYKGPGEIESKGYGNVSEAHEMIRFASKAYEKQPLMND